MSPRHNPNDPAIGEMSRRFNQARLHANLTLAELEKRSGCAMSMLSGIATGDRMPRIDSVAKIARALGVSAGWLAYGDGPRPEWLTEADSQSEKSELHASDS